jgi:hypothetical protein
MAFNMGCTCTLGFPKKESPTSESVGGKLIVIKLVSGGRPSPNTVVDLHTFIMHLLNQSK